MSTTYLLKQKDEDWSSHLVLATKEDWIRIIRQKSTLPKEQRRYFIKDCIVEKGVKCIGCPAGGTCPSAGKMKKKKLEGPVLGKKIMEISGMSCDHCVMNVTAMLNRIDGVSAEVNLSKGRAVVSYDREIGDDILKDAVEMIGYQVTGIRQK